MSETSVKRLSKVAKELNISIGSIVEFLGKKGFKIESNPNGKIGDEEYGHLLKEFQSDKKAKEESEQLLKAKEAKKDLAIEASKQEVKVVAAALPTQTTEEVASGPTASTNPVIDEPKEFEIKSTAKKIEVKEGEENVIIAKSDEEISVKVKGKIDLSTLNSKTKPDKKKKETKEEIAEAKKSKLKVSKKADPTIKSKGKAENEAIAEKEQIKEESVPVLPDTTETPVKPDEVIEEDNIHVTKYEKLGGVKLLGKMELPVKEEKKKIPAGSSNSNADLAKKKRKRIKKTVNKEFFNTKGEFTPGSRPPGQAGATAPNQAGGAAPSRPNDFRNKNYKGNKPPEKVEKAELTAEEIQAQIKETLARLSGAGKSKTSKLRRQKRDTFSEKRQEAADQEEADKSTLKVTEFVSASELSRMMNVPVNEVISTCMSLGMFVSINQRLSAETIVVVAEEFGYKVEFVSAEDTVDSKDEADKEEDLITRPPIVTVMGHVDHGKTSLLDYIRKANVIAGEAGGITQHIGAYAVELDGGRKIAFLDTPGHEAFTAMRARGAQVTDIVIVVVAADDNVMPQTKEAINHAQAASVPIVFAINKIDKPGANPDKIREELSAMNILVEEWGGKYQCQEISAKKGTNIDTLLEKVLLEADLLELKANPNKNAIGTVIESSLDKGRGYISTILVQSGTLKVGDIVLAGSYSGRVKALTNERNATIKKAGPSTPALMLGLSGAPTAGDKFKVMSDEREAREIATKRMQLLREQGYRSQKHITLDEIGRRLAIGDFKELNIIVKGDVDGSIEALTDALLKLSTEQVQVNVIHKSVGQVTESDVLLASASNAIIVGFQVRPSLNARKIAEQEQIEIRLYSIIYDAINEIKAAMEGMLAPEYEEKITCNVQVRQVFKISKGGTIAGCMVTDGKITRNSKVRIIRNGIVIHTGHIDTLKRFKDDAKEVATGYECGISIEKFNDIEENDVIEGYEMVEVKRKGA
ncbi:MAG: translation initiation factor IF-2 [Bacteroidota bacterium]|jgi:translation initiation factor IF-2